MFRRLMISFSVIIVLMMLLVGIANEKMLSDVFNEEIRIAYFDELRIQQSRILGEVDQINSSILEFCSDSQLQTLVRMARGGTANGAEWDRLEGEVIQSANSLSFLNMEILLPEQGVCLSWDKEGKRLKMAAGQAVRERMAGLEELQKVPNIVQYDVGTRDSIACLQISRGIYDTRDWTGPIGFLSVDVDLFPFVSGLMNTSSRMLLLSETGKQIYPYFKVENVEQIMAEMVSEIPAVVQTEKVYLYRVIPMVNWNVISELSRDSLLENGRGIYRSMGLVTLVAVLLSAILSAFLAYQIAHPIEVLSRSMHSKTQFPDKLVVNKKKLPEEIYSLYTSYNGLLAEIDDLIKQVYVAKIKEQESELAALQAQINPHLIYNTLDSINWLAYQYHAEDIQKIAHSLATMLRYSLNNGQNMIRLGDELKQIKNYFVIQSYRYPEQFQVCYEVDESLLEVKIPKLLFQPLAENALKHGIEEDGKGAMKIRIEVKREGDALCMSLSNQCTQAKYFALCQALTCPDDAPGHGYGIKNVNDRLCGRYGPECRIRFAFTGEGYIQASIHIPLEEEDRDGEEVQDDGGRASQSDRGG